MNRALVVALAAFCSAGVAEAATGIEQRILDHIERAAADGVGPEDYHHLVFAFYWRDTLPDPALVERALDRLSTTARLDPLMADELRTMRARLAAEAGRPAAARWG